MQSPVLESGQELRCTTSDDSTRTSDSVATSNGACEIDAAATRSELCSDTSDLDDEGIGESESDVVRTQSCHSAATDVGSSPLHAHSTSDMHSYISESIHRQNLTDVCDLVGTEPSLSVVADDVGNVGAPTELDGSVHNGGTSSSGGSSSTLVDCGKDAPGGAGSDDDVAKLPSCENWQTDDSGKESVENSDEEYRRYFRATLTNTTDSAERGKAGL